MQIRRNTKAFKAVNEIITSCRDRADRQEMVRLYITRAGQSIKDRIAIEGTKSEATFFYDLGYQAVLNNLNSSNHQLYQSDDVPGIYYFHSTISKDWAEAPFEFDVRVKDEFSSLPELPATREKGKEKEFVLPTELPKKEKAVKEKPVKKAVATEHKATMYVNSNLDRIAFRNPQLTRKDVLDYYEKISKYMLHHSKDDRDHLQHIVEQGKVDFEVPLSKKNSPDVPDYSLIFVDSGTEFTKAVEAAQVAKYILDGLKLPAFVKTDGISGLHIHIPLDSSSTFEASKNFAEYICRLIRLKAPDLVTVHGNEEYTYGKVTLDYSLNEQGKTVIAPYSLVAKSAALVAAPLSWDEIEEGVKVEDFNYETIFQRLKKDGDPFENFHKKKVNANEKLEIMEEYYSFLL